jgi:urocanate hydratase
MPASDLNFPEIPDVYERFRALAAMSPNPRGWLLLYSGLDRDGIALAMASNVASAASLGIEPDPARAKGGLRRAVCDFVVNHLDEALRILKNEIRQERGVSVVLIGEVQPMVAQMVERGVQPDVLAFPVPELIERGARLLAVGIEDGLDPVIWSVEKDALRWLPLLDSLAAESLKDHDARIRWLEAAPRYLGRELAETRYLPMTSAEADAFVRAVRGAVRSHTIGAAVNVSRGGDTISVVP